jgi:lysophospholipase L1-like esterase
MSRLIAESRRILFVGSSTTAGTGPSSPDKVYTALVTVARPDDVITVRAEGGTLVNDWLSQGTVVTGPTTSSLTVLDADAAQFAIGDYFQLYTSADVLKEQTAFTISNIINDAGANSTIQFTPAAATTPAVGNVIKLAYSLTQQDVAFVQLGVNDWYVPVVADTFKTQVQTMLSRLRVQSPNIQLFWLRTWMPNSDDVSRIQMWNDYEVALADVVTQPGPWPCRFLDMRESNRSLYWFDPTGFHYNDFGHQLLAKKVLEWV